MRASAADRATGRPQRRLRAAACAGLLALLAILAPLSGTARAQQAEPEAEAEDPFARPGYPLGKFRIYPSLTIDNFYNDNIFADAEPFTIGDYLISVIPRVALKSTWARHAFSVSGSGQINRYANVTEENNDEYEVEVRGRLDLAETSELGAIFGYGRETVGRADSENTNRIVPNQFDYLSGELVYDHTFSRFDLNLRGFAEDLDYLDPRDDDRDRVVFGGSLELRHRRSEVFAVYLEPDIEVRDYKQPVDDNLIMRSNVQLAGFVGTTFQTATIDVDVALGPVYAGFDDPGFADLTILGVEASAGWQITGLTRLGIEVERGLLQTDVEDASSKLRTQASLQLSHKLLENVILRSDATYFHEKFEGLGREDNNYRVEVGGEYLVNRFFTLSLGYDYRIRDSSDLRRSFRRNRVMLAIDARL